VGPLLFAQVNYFYKLAHGRGVEVGMIFNGFKRYALTFVLSLLVFLWSVIWMLPVVFLFFIIMAVSGISFVFGVISDGSILNVLAGLSWWLLLLLALSLLVAGWGLYVQARYSQVWFLVAKDNKLTASEAVKKSVQMMQGHIGEYIMLELSFLGWIFLGILFFGIGLLWVVPYKLTTMANYFDQLNGKTTKKSQSKK
jgi:uncharacterized membrane protein